MKKASCPKPLKMFVKTLKRKFTKKRSSEQILEDTCTVTQHNCNQLCGQNCRHQCALPPCVGHKSATLPAKPLSTLTCASPLNNFPSPTPSTSNTSILSTDSGLGSQAPSDDEYGDVFTDDDCDYENNIQSFVEDDSWWIDGNQIALKKVIFSSSWETVYSGYWHGNVEVHTRRSSDSELRAHLIADVDTLTSIRHENIQLFLGFSDNLHPDYVSIVMDQMKGYSLHNLIHKQGKQFTCHYVNKIASQIAQGVDYLHAKGISHPMLSSKSISVNYRVCISMLSQYGASAGYIQSDDVAYLPPEAIKSVTSSTGFSNNGELLADPNTTLTQEANIYSFGTLMYEMICKEKPHSDVPVGTLVSLVCSNAFVPVTKALPEGRYRQLVKKCWRNQPSERPTFKEILLTLETTTSSISCGLKASSPKLSVSEPKRLNQLGL